MQVLGPSEMALWGTIYANRHQGAYKKCGARLHFSDSRAALT